MRRTARLALSLTLALVMMAACGGGDAADDGGGNGTADGGNSVPSTVGDIPGVSSECEALANLSLSIGQVFAGSFERVPDGVVEGLPGSVQPDGRVVAEALDEFADRLAELGIDLSGGLGQLTQEQLEAFTDISAEVLNDDVDDAANRIGEAMAADCAPGG